MNPTLNKNIHISSPVVTAKNSDIEGLTSTKISFNLKSMYLCVKDMDRAIHFYEELLSQKVTEKDEIYSVFDIHGFRLGLFAHEKMKEPKQWGNNCLPSLEVNNMNLVLKKLEKLNCRIVFPMTVIGQNQVLEFQDSEGNDIEVTCPIA